MRRSSVPVCMVGILFCSVARGQGVTQGEDASLKELMELLNTPVVSATKTEGLKSHEAPAIIRVITETEIRDQGFQSLRDILMHVAGIEMEYYRSAHSVAWVRGVQTRYNSKVQLLVDGIPIRDSFTQNYNLSSIIPVSMIDRIEVINGPGSVLYGSGAFAGVVSVTTKKVGRSAALAGGSLGLREAMAEWDLVREGAGFYIQGRRASMDGFDPERSVDGVAWDHPQESKDVSALVKGWVGGWSFQGGLFASEYPDKYREGSSGGRRDRTMEHKPWFASAKYEAELSRGMALRASGFFQDFGFQRREHSYTATGAPKRFRVSDFGTTMMGLDADLSFTKGSHQMLFGVAHLEERGSGLLESTTSLPSGLTSTVKVLVDASLKGTDSFERRTSGVFAQDIWRLTESVSAITGVRYDKLSTFDDQFNLRLGLMGAKGKLFGKVLFGTAYRVPSVREMADEVSHNYGLKPEKIQTVELQGGTQWARGKASLTLYRNHYTDFIKDVYALGAGGPGAYRTTGDEYAFNADSRTIVGAEFDTTFMPVSGLTLTLNVSHLFKAEEVLPIQDPGSPTYVNVDTSIGSYLPGRSSATFLARTMVNALATLRLGRGVSVGASLHHRSQRGDVPAGFQSGIPAGARNAAVPDGFLMAGANVLWTNNTFRVALSAQNLGDRKVFSPSLLEEKLYGLEWAGRTWRFEAGYRF